MSRKKLIQTLAIVFLILAIILLIPNTDWSESTSVYGFISLVFGTGGSIISIFIPTSHTLSFTKKDWLKNSEEGYYILIQAKKHGIGTAPHVQTFLKENNLFSEVGVSSNHDEHGNVTIGANITFDGKVIIT